MLHAEGLLSLEFAQSRRCSMLDLFLEMDRILRPEVNSLILIVKWISWIHCLVLQVNKACNFLQGWVVMRDTAALIETARAFATQLRWDARVVETESNSNERILICQKPFTKKL